MAALLPTLKPAARCLSLDIDRITAAGDYNTIGYAAPTGRYPFETHAALGFDTKSQVRLDTIFGNGSH